MIIAGVDVPDRLIDIPGQTFGAWFVGLMGTEDRLRGRYVEFLTWIVRQNQPLSWAMTHYNNFFTVSQSPVIAYGVSIPAENVDVTIEALFTFLETITAIQSREYFCRLAAQEGCRVSECVESWLNAPVDHQTGRGPRSQAIADMNSSSPAARRLSEQDSVALSGYVDAVMEGARSRSNMTMTRSGRKVNFGVTGGRLSR